LVRLRPGLGAPQPDGSLRVDLDFWPTANRFVTGHAIRLLVASGAFPRVDRNLGGGEPIAAAKQMYSSVQTIYHDCDHPSALTLPVTSA
jgi:predicted acyl esterase